MGTTFDGKRVLVTGAASGIGKETALAFARRGARMFVCDLDLEKLGAVAEDLRAAGSPEVVVGRVDVSDRARMRAYADEVHARGGALDVLVNNAGVAISGGFLDTSLEDWDWIVSINVMGVVHGCHLFAPKMVERGHGHVVNVASAAGYFPSAALSAYTATKHAVLGLSQAMREELHPLGVGVSAICPGIVNTPLTHNAKPRGKMADPKALERVRRYYEKRGASPRTVGEAIVGAVERDRGVVPVAPDAWAMYVAKRISPTLSAALARKLQSKITGIK